MRCVVCHDAGGAEVLASYVARQGGQWQFVLEGPARRVFERRLGNVTSISLEDAAAACSQFLTGSSWQSDLEWRAIMTARQTGKPVTTFLDHWVNYRERFSRNGVECLPETLWVGDAYALERAKAIFPELEIRFVPNPYFQDIQEELGQHVHKPPRSSKGLQVLFVSEPISEHAEKTFSNPSHWGYTEFDAIRFLQANLCQLGEEIVSLVIRPHPAESPEKYEHIVNEWGGVARLGGKVPLIQEIIAADIVVGCASMAMVVGLLADKEVYCAIPPGGTPCPLPHREIKNLAAIVEKVGGR